MPARFYLLLTDRLVTSVGENRDFINWRDLIKKRGWTNWTPQDLSLEGSLKSSMERRRRLHRSSTASGGLGWFRRWWGLPLLLQWSWCYQHSSQRRVHSRWLFCTLRLHIALCDCFALAQIHLHGARCAIMRAPLMRVSVSSNHQPTTSDAASRWSDFEWRLGTVEHSVCVEHQSIF